MDRELKLIIENMADDIRELKESSIQTSKLIQETALLRQELKSLQENYEEKLKFHNSKHDEGRKVLHKRMDAYAKISFWFGTTIFTTMGAVIFTLVQRIIGG